ncbi:MAG TPA: CotH kinase family protein [Kofleriaceae bacterium]|nr:CotH kinase family protein [Kofleriaceae bacterium]
MHPPRPLLVLPLLAACGGGGGGTDGGIADAGDPPDAYVDLSAPLFEPDHLLDIQIDLADADWDALRLQTRSIFDVLGQSCLEEPPGSPFTYFPATVTIDGEELADVGVRKKGFFGSLSTTKPSLKVNFDEYQAGREYLGLDKLTLNNAISDPSEIKQCLGYQLFNQAGIDAPRCNFARVTVNGAYLGIYVNVEAVDKKFLARHYDDNDGNLYEGALSDFRPGWVTTFDKKTNETDPDRSDLQALTDALGSAADAELATTLEPLVDLDQFMTFWAMELILMHADGYDRNTNNFLVYHDPTTGKFRFIPWGIDSILFPDAALPWETVKPPDIVWAEGALSWRLYRNDDTRDQYLDRVQQMLDQVWDEDAILGEVDRMEALIDGYVPVAQATTFAGGVQAVRDFVGGRRATLETALGATPPTWDKPLRDPWCIDVLGTVSGVFDTTWDTLDDNDPFATGTCTVDLDLPGRLFNNLDGGANSGIDATSGMAVINQAVITGATEAVILHVETDPSHLVAGTTLQLDWTEASGYAVAIDFSTDPATFTIIGLLGDGTVRIDAVGTNPGDPVTGFIDSSVYESIF